MLYYGNIAKHHCLFSVNALPLISGNLERSVKAYSLGCPLHTGSIISRAATINSQSGLRQCGVYSLIHLLYSKQYKTENNSRFSQHLELN